MNFRQRYNMIIELIEEKAMKKDWEIQDLLCNTGNNIRMIADAFRFITDMTLSTYIRRRKLINAMIFKLENKCSIEDVAETFSFADAATLSKSFKKEFGRSPSKVTIDDLLNEKPLKIDVVLNEENKMSEGIIEMTTVKQKFGVEVDKFNEIKQILDVNAIYGFSDEYAEMAYNLSKIYNVSIFRAFSFMEDVILQIENDTFKQWFGEWIDKPDFVLLENLAFLSFKYGFSVTESQEEIFRLKDRGIKDITKLSDEFFDVYFAEGSDFEYTYIMRILKKLKEHGFTSKDYSEIATRAWMFDDDILETIEHYDELREEELGMLDMEYDDVEEREVIWAEIREEERLEEEIDDRISPWNKTICEWDKDNWYYDDED